MTVRHLRVFVTVCECGGITKAAELMHVAQPAVSQTIADIEKYYGVVLFDRINHKLVLTDGGKNLLLKAKEVLAEQDVKARVISMPCLEEFEKQSDEYKESVLPCRCKTIAIEMGCSHGWYKYAKRVIGIDTFGLSAPAGVLAKHFGFTAEDIAKKL